MSRHGKKYRASAQKVDCDKKYELKEAIGLAKESNSEKFDESLDVAIRLSLDPRKADQNIRGSVVLPKGTGKKFRVLVFAKGEKESEAKAAGAEAVGGEDLVAKIQGGWMEFDRIVATPDMMGQVGKLGKVLGPRGLMPNPKSGTVSNDVSKAVNELKAGKIEFRVDKEGIIHVGIGKLSFEADKIIENFNTFMDAIIKAKPNSLKGKYVKKVSISSTMGPGLKLDVEHN